MSLEQRLLRHEIGLRVEEMATATAGLSPRTLWASALDREASLRSKPALADNLVNGRVASCFMANRDPASPHSHERFCFILRD
jgi:hypothetical protein